MNRSSISLTTLCILAALSISACEQNDAPKKTPSRTDKIITGTWFEGEWINTEVKSPTPPQFRISAEMLMWDGCTLHLGSLVSRDEQKAFLDVQKGGECPSEKKRPSTVILQRKGDCAVSVELYASTEDLKQSVVQASATYTKSGCTPPGAH